MYSMEYTWTKKDTVVTTNNITNTRGSIKKPQKKSKLSKDVPKLVLKEICGEKNKLLKFLKNKIHEDTQDKKILKVLIDAEIFGPKKTPK